MQRETSFFILSLGGILRNFLKKGKKDFEKIEAVLRIVNDGMSVRESARILGASPANVRMWRELYLKNGPDSLKYKRMTYDGAYKTAVVEYMYQHKLTLLETAIHFGITQSSLVGKWAKQYMENGGSAAFSAGKSVIKKESDELKVTETMNGKNQLTNQPNYKKKHR